jgi:hypothetical protein
VVGRSAAAAALAEAEQALRHLLTDATTVVPPLSRLLSLFHLPSDAAALLQAIEQEAPSPDLPEPPVAGAGPLDPASLAALEASLARADVAHFARRAPICTPGKDALAEDGFSLAWEKRFLSVAELAAMLTPGRAPDAEPWLFRRLTRTLDRRMLALLAAPEELRGAGPFALNLTIASILSPQFLRFDTALPSALRGRVVIDLLACDILADASFVFARDFARARGYRLLLRSVTEALLSVLSPTRLDVDFLELRWSSALARIDAAVLAAMGTPPDRLVLGRADTPEALVWGRRCGIALYKGGMARPA